MNKIYNYILKVKAKLNISYSKSDYKIIYGDLIKSVNGISNLKVTDDFFEFAYFELPLFARFYPCSDVLVINQVFLQKEYKPVVDYYKDNFPNYLDLYIIDAGANVGYASIYFLKHFPNATITCIEPEIENVKMIERNLSNYITKGAVKIFERALLGESDKSILIKRDFRGGSDWALRVEETKEDTTLSSITIDTIIKENQREHIDILKIDIEGAERFVLNKNTDLSFLSKVKILVVEIHDEFEVRDDIYMVLKDNNFLVLNFGETTFCVNRKFI